jgi:sugar phosphate isomerase/epimerase
MHALSTSRRQFLAELGLLTLPLLTPSTSHAIAPLKRSGKPRLLLSLAAYSFRDFFKHTNHPRGKVPEGRPQIDLFQFIDFCAEHHCAGTELTSYYFPNPIPDGYLLELRRHAFLRGIAVSGTAVGNDFTLPPGPERQSQIAATKTWIDHAGVLGAPHVRVFAGTGKNLAKTEAKRLCIEALEECADYAGRKGIFLGLENHGGIVAEAADLLDIVRAAKSPWVGINLDTGNFRTADPYGDLERCAPYAVNVQVKVEMRAVGGKNQPADLKRLVQLLRGANYQGFVALEYEAAPDPWQAVPAFLAQLHDLFP